MSNILPYRCYAGIDADSIAYTEQHLRRVERLRLPPGDDAAARYIRRMSECRPTRRCNLSACPSCEAARSTRFIDEVLKEARLHPADAFMSADVLFPPRDRLASPARGPRDDVREFREIVHIVTPRDRDFGSYIFFLGRYEVAVKRPASAAYLRRFPAGARSRSVVPHVHFLAVAMQGRRYMRPQELGDLLRISFPAERQVMVKGLRRTQAPEQALRSRVAYMFKKRTSDLTGRFLQDFVTSQVRTRQDAWVLRYRRDRLFPIRPTAGPTPPYRFVFY